MGIEEQRVQFEHISASEAVRYAKIMDDFTNTIAELGPHKFSKQQAEETEIKP